MTPTIDTLREVREALERIADKRNTHFAGDAQVVASAALTKLDALIAAQEEPAGKVELCKCGAPAKQPHPCCYPPAQPPNEPAKPYAPITAKEAHDLTAMVYGAPWESDYCESLVEVLAQYEKLRATGQRPVDPADMSANERQAHFAAQEKQA